MRSSILSAAPILASIAGAAPLVPRQDTNIDVTVLQFALTLEHLENNFYKGALQKFSQQDFQNAGFSAQYYENLKYIAHDEEEHVKLLSGALSAAGVTPVKACEYSFPYTNPRGFVTLSSVIEGVGTSAYLGAAPLVTSKDYLAVAGSILVTEALHTSLQRYSVGEIAAANPYGTGLDPTSVYTIAAPFIKSCPADNPPLPFKPFPTLTLTSQACKDKRDLSIKLGQKDHGKGKDHGYGHEDPEGCPAPEAPCAGEKIVLTAEKHIPEDSYVTFVSGLAVVSVKGQISDNTITAEVPAVVEGQSYVFVSSKDVEGKLDDTAVLAGPAIVEVKPQPPTIDYNYQK